MSDTEKLYYDKDHGRFEWSGDRRSPAIEADISSASYDAPWLEFDGIDPDELCRRWNNHERLVEALRNMVIGFEPRDGSDYRALTDANELLATLEAEKGGG